MVSESQNPRESVPESTILIPILANTSESSAAPSTKSRMRVASSTKTLVNPIESSPLRSLSRSEVVVRPSMRMYAACAASSGSISSTAWRIIVVLPVRRSP